MWTELFMVDNKFNLHLLHCWMQSLCHFMPVHFVFYVLSHSCLEMISNSYLDKQMVSSSLHIIVRVLHTILQNKKISTLMYGHVLGECRWSITFKSFISVILILPTYCSTQCFLYTCAMASLRSIDILAPYKLAYYYYYYYYYYYGISICQLAVDKLTDCYGLLSVHYKTERTL